MTFSPRRRPAALVAALAALVLALLGAGPAAAHQPAAPAAAHPPAAPAAQHQPAAAAAQHQPAGWPGLGTRDRYTNPITEDFADTYADPAVIRGKDGFWYLYATSDPLVEGGPFGIMHVARSTDLVSWEYLGTIFDETTRPAWATPTSFFWAPDIRYVDGRYVLYYTVTDTAAEPGDSSAIGAATAPTPAGPWTDTGGPVVAPRPDGGGGYYWTFDPAMFLDDDGRRYLYFGSYHGGVWVTELDETGLRAVGEPTQVTTAERYEGTFVVKRGGHYYLMASSGNCCAGPVTGYSVYAGRAEDPRGPFVDHEGVPLLDPRPGGTQVLVQNGNRWIGPGHHTVVADLSGQDQILYHALDRNRPWLAEPGGINRRPTLLDRLDWIDGWPLARAGAGPSDSPQPAPVAGTLLGIDADAPAAGTALRVVDGTLSAGTDEAGDAGQTAVLDGTARTRHRAPREVRVEADVRTGGPALTVGLGGSRGVTVTLDPASRELRAATTGRRAQTVTAEIPAGHDLGTWTALSVHVADGVAHAVLSESRLGDVVAEVTLDLPHRSLEAQALTLATDGPVDLDNLSVNRAAEPVTRAVPDPRAGRVVLAEEFDDGDLSGWTWVRPDPAARVDAGALRWPVGAGDLVGPANTGSLLLREPPAGSWIMETRLDLDLGRDEIRNYQQAGLIVRADDDHFVRLGHVAIWGTRQAEFGKEMPEGEALRWGAHLGGPVAPSMWLRIYHSTDPRTGELRYRSATSRDGEHWRWGATWTLPAGSEPQVGLYTGGGAEPPTEAAFDYVRFYRAR
ncbi:family 43 glycosylhydrolase [Georgenia sp. TF02-10]|uniref:family 43 glycosylhydrolase n=1 Tax=Georgenia sp. TF02-10 TaxID=2917725 RepID=UPI002111B4AE|nr:family 43 glycosylhydrolase [Georgenia sp. TF02-10]